jgi:hypothetical protein
LPIAVPLESKTSTPEPAARGHNDGPRACVLSGELLRQASASLDAALTALDSDVEAARDDLVAARLLLATALTAGRAQAF